MTKPQWLRRSCMADADVRFIPTPDDGISGMPIPDAENAIPLFAFCCIGEVQCADYDYDSIEAFLWLGFGITPQIAPTIASGASDQTCKDFIFFITSYGQKRASTRTSSGPRNLKSRWPCFSRGKRRIQLPCCRKLLLTMGIFPILRWRCLFCRPRECRQDSSSPQAGQASGRGTWDGQSCASFMLPARRLEPTDGAILC